MEVYRVGTKVHVVGYEGKSLCGRRFSRSESEMNIGQPDEVTCRRCYLLWLDSQDPPDFVKRVPNSKSDEGQQELFDG